MALDYKARYRAYLQTDHWQALRQDLFTLRGHHCAICSSDDLVDAHHLAYRNLIDCTPDDLMPLCRHCHDLVHLWHRDGNLNRRQLQAQTYPERVKILQDLHRHALSQAKRTRAVRNGVTFNQVKLTPKPHRTHFRVLTKDEYNRL